MKQRAQMALLIGALAFVGGLKNDSSEAQTSDDQTGAQPAFSKPSPADSFPWPHQFTHDEQSFTVYPPQFDRWQGEQLEGRAVVSVQPLNGQKQVFGVLWLSARTTVDRVTGTVSVWDITISRDSFPSAPAHALAYLDAVRQHLSALRWSVARERLDSELAIEHASRESQSQPLGNRVPRILYSDSPAILVPIDGSPQLKEMVALELLRVINTRALILQEKQTGRYFLFLAGHWMEANAIEGPWTESQVRPAALEQAKQQAVDGGQVDLIEGAESAQGRVPIVFVTTVPGELVQTDGPPQYAPIASTQLLYVTNSPNRLFLDLPTQQYYLLLSGRWYRTSSLRQSTWESVASAGLPPDFARIPDSHPTESVRAAVAGTPQAQEAVIENSVPQVAAVRRSAATLELTYDGAPQFESVEGTALQRAVNAPIPVIRVNEDAFYALSNSVWFVANSPFGPWTTATSVPPVIYTIPNSSPVHYVTYVRVYEATPEVVYEGYTPGYIGSYVAPGDTVVYGTGWYYRPWVGSVWYGPPVTWGFGFSVFNSWWSPWPWWGPWWGVASWRAPQPCFHPAWGPWIAHVAVPRRGVMPVSRQAALANANNVAMNNKNMGLPVAVARTGASVTGTRATVNPVNASANISHIFQRWGTQVASPLGGPATRTPTQTVATQRPGGMPPAPLQINTKASPVQGATMPARPDLAYAAMAAPVQTTRTPAPGPAPSLANVTPARPVQENPNVQSFRNQEGHFQRRIGNGPWENLRMPNVPSTTQSPRGVQTSESQVRNTGLPRNLPAVPNRDSIRSTTNPPSQALHIVVNNNPASSSSPDRVMPSALGQFARPPMLSFVPGNSGSAQGRGTGPPAVFGPSGGGSVAPSQGHAQVGGHVTSGGGSGGGGGRAPGSGHAAGGRNGGSKNGGSTNR